MVFEVYSVLISAPVTGLKLKLSGVVSATNVLTVKPSVTHPIFRVALTRVLLVGDEVT
jgi:hypothetical protein